MRKQLLNFLPLCLMIALLSYGCAQQTGNVQTTAPAVGQKQAKLPKGVTEIKTAGLKALMGNSTDFMLIDARPEKSYAVSHIADAVSLPVADYREKANSTLPKDKDKLLILYCGGSACGMSAKVAGQAKKNGYKNIRVYLAGQPAWIKAGNLVYAGKGTIEKGNIVLIDLRSVKKSANGHIARSVTMPYVSLDDRLDDIPMKAPLVLYSDSEKEVADAVEVLRAEGFKKVALVPGNYAGWVKAGGKTVKGSVVTDINWKKKLAQGEVSKTDFLKAARGSDSSAVILDVRTVDETAAGGFKNAIAVPLDQISSRLMEIPKDKKIYAYCSTGARADMAAQELKENGYRAFFLGAEVECEDHDCTIED